MENDTEWDDELELDDELDADGFDEDEPVTAESQGGGDPDDPETAEVEARKAAGELADQVIREDNGESDAPRYSEEPDKLAIWMEWLEGHLAERQAEREAAEALWEAEEAAAAGDDESEESEPADFARWPSADFTDLMDRVTGAMPVNAARRSVSDEQFERGLALIGGE